MEAQDRSFDDIAIGERALIKRVWSKEDVARFALLSGDTNPLHTDVSYASHTLFGRPIVHGILLSSLASRLVGMHIPGKRCLLLKHEISFKKPIYEEEEVTLTGEVVSKSESTQLITVKLSFTRGEEEVASGSMVTQVMNLEL